MLGKSKSVMYRQISQSDTSQLTEGSKLIKVDKITPLDFDRFIPWVCKEWGVIESVSVFRTVQEDIVKKSIVSKRKSVGLSTSKTSLPLYNLQDKSSGVDLCAHYDTTGHLIEISILKCPITIPRKVILAINLCLLFHPTLTRLSIRRGGLNYYIIYEIGKLLPHSNLTSICLDDSYVPQGNYHVLLEDISQLNYLSLKRCKINDEVCKRIAEKLDIGKPASNCLRALELASNNITDTGAQCLGGALRTNRCLMHLNLADNKITDNGASAVLNPLMEFSLTKDEVLKMKCRKLMFFKNKLSVYKRCLEEVMHQMDSTIQIRNTIGTPTKTIVHKKSKKLDSTPSRYIKPEDIAEKMAQDIVGEFKDPHYPLSVNLEGGCYVKGNFILCSLNLAYNNLQYSSLQKLDEVVTYQIITSQSVSFSADTEVGGLVRVNIVGNNMPETSDEFERIELILRAKRVHIINQNKKNVSSVSAKNKSSKSTQVMTKKKLSTTI